MVVQINAHTQTLCSTSLYFIEVPKLCISYCPASGSWELKLSLSIYVNITSK